MACSRPDPDSMGPMLIRETLSHGSDRFVREFHARDLDEFRRALVDCPYPVSLGRSEGNEYVTAAWESLTSDGTGNFGWADYQRVKG